MEPTDLNRAAWDEIHRRRAEQSAERPGIPAKILELLPDVSGRHVLHLECGTGEGTAELVERGALVTAVDLSAEAIEAARERAPDVVYLHADVHELPLELHRGRFDLVLTGGAVLHWLHDLDAWAGGIAAALKPGGLLVFYDSHPVSECVDPLGHWRDNYFDPAAATEHDLERHWQLGELVAALTGAGLGITRVAEFQTLYDWAHRDRRVPWDFALIAERRV